jgi:hypothetical protein
MIALNNGSTPVLSYIQDTVFRIGASGPDQPDFTNKSVVTSLGMVISRREIATQASDTGTQLEVIVAHCDWDGEVSLLLTIYTSLPILTITLPQERVHRRFNIKYIVPGTKNLVKTHTLYQVGREVNIIGRLVDFNMEDQIAIVVVRCNCVIRWRTNILTIFLQVSSVSITSGHQIGRANPVGPGPSNSSPTHGRKLYVEGKLTGIRVDPY